MYMRKWVRSVVEGHGNSQSKGGGWTGGGIIRINGVNENLNEGNEGKVM
jgi:hypothetical protein